MAVKRLFQSRPQFFDNSGNPASGYRLFFYVAGQQTKQSTYNSSSGLVANSNPIVLNSRGEPATEIWGTVGLTYKLALAAPGSDDPPGAFVWTEDNVACINDVSAEVTIDQWLSTNLVPTFISSTSFSVPGDKTSDFVPGRRIKTANNGGTVYSTIVTSAFTSLTTITVSNDSPGVLDAGLNSVSLGIITPTNSSMPWSLDDRLTIVDNADTSKRLQFQLSGITTGTTRVITIPDANFTPISATSGDTLQNKTYQNPIFSGTSTGSLTDITIGGTATINALAGNAVATQAQMEAGSATNAAVTPGRMKNFPGVIKAFGYVTYSGGTPSYATSFGMSGSITDAGTGLCTFTMATAMSTTNYVVIATATTSGAVASEIDSARTTTTFQIQVTRETAGALAASDQNFNFIVLGDQ